MENLRNHGNHEKSSKIMEQYTKFKKPKVAIMGNPKQHQNYIWKHVKIIENNGKSKASIESYGNHLTSNRKP